MTSPTDGPLFSLVSPSSMVEFSSPSLTGSSPRSPQIEQSNLKKPQKKKKINVKKLLRSRFGCESCKTKKVKVSSTKKKVCEPDTNRVYVSAMRLDHHVIDVKLPESNVIIKSLYNSERTWRIKGRNLVVKGFGQRRNHSCLPH